MFWTIEKLAKRIEELSSYRYRNIQPLNQFDSLFDEKGEIGEQPPKSGEWATMEIGGRWEGRDTYLWLKTTVSIPKEWQEEKVVGFFDFGKTGGGNNAGFESLLYVNKKPYQGVDSNHQEVFFEESLTGSEVELCFRLWSGLEGGGQPVVQEHRLQTAFLCCLDQKLDDLYFTAVAVLETVKQLDENQPERSLLLKPVDRAFQAIDWSQPGSEDFYESTYRAREILKEELEKVPHHFPVKVHAIGHTHIDVAWLWRLKHTREKAARSFSTVLRLMEQYPEYQFLQTQPQLYEYIKNDYPGIYQQIKERIEEGRWEAAGGMWVEADCNLTSGESLVRQLLLGTRFFKKEFNKDCEYLWLPDVFGYSWALPQILAKSGIKTFMTTKISWSQYNKMPHDTFKWRGIDGTEILTHFITTPEDERGYYTYNGQITPKTVKGIWDNYRDKEVNQELLLSYGYGDGGGGVNRDMLEMRRRLDNMPGLPEVKTGRADDYFRRLHQTIKETNQYVHTWDGELYLEYHRGTYTSQAYNKRMNRKMELLLREAEWMSALNTVHKKNWENYPAASLTESWKIVLRNQFHDIIPGSSIREVYQDSKSEYEQADKQTKDVWKKAAKALVEEEENAYTVFNSASFTRNDLVIIDVPEKNISWKDDQEQTLGAQQTFDGRWAIQAENLPSLGSRTFCYTKEEEEQQSSPFIHKSRGVITPFYDINWDKNGQLTQIFDSKNNRYVLAEDSNGNVLQVFEDKPLQYDAWDIDLFYQQKSKEIRELISCRVIEDGAVRTVIQFEWKYENSVIRQHMLLYAKNPRIDFETKLDWHEREQLLKVAFPVNVRAAEATYDIQYGNVKRPTHWNTSWDYARFESVGHQWVDLSETGYGISLLNDCKYGHDIKDNVIRLTLLKSSIKPDVEQDQGEHFFTYSLLPHQGDWRQAGTVQEAWMLNNPLTSARGSSESFSLFRTDCNHVMIDAVKKAEDENKLVVRMHEFTGARASVEITSDASIVSWQECNLMELPIGGTFYGKPYPFTINPYEIKTFLVEVNH